MVHASYPLTPNQWGIVFHDLVHPGSLLYDVMWTCPVTGTLDDDSLKRALLAVVIRHEALRTRFDLDDIATGGGGRQVVETEPRLDLALVDLEPEAASRLCVGDLGLAERAELSRLVAPEPFDLARTPLFRVRVLRADAERHRLVFDFHHLVFDGWSVGVFLRDLAVAYADCLAGGAGELASEDDLTWGRWAVLEEEQRSSLASQRDHWRRALDGVPQESTFPSERPRPHPARFRGDEVERRLPRELRDAVADAARRVRVTPFVLLFTAFALLLAARSGQRDVAIGCPMGVRARPDVRHLIGYIINMTVLRLQVELDEPVADVVARARGAVFDAMDNQDVPFDQIVGDVAGARGLSHNPLFQVLFSFEEGDEGDLDLGPARIGEVVGLPTFAAKFDVTFTTRWAEDLLELNLEYDTDLYDAATVEGLADDYVLVLDGLVSRADRPVRELGVEWSTPSAEPSAADGSATARVVTADYVAPRTDTERRLVALWGEVLEADEVGIDDNFFQLGGDSLRASRLIGRVTQLTAIDVPVRTLFDEPTIRNFAARLNALQADASHERGDDAHGKSSPGRPRPRAKRSTTTSE